MPKIAFMGAGSTVFVKNVIGDCMMTDALRDAHFALYDIDVGRMRESRRMLEAINRTVNAGRARITTHLGPERRRAALKKADYVINAINVGGYEPATINDFEIPKQYGLRQTIADTLGVGGIFRALRTVPVMLDFARDIEAVCPDAWFLNYTNPMSILTGAMLSDTSVKTVGLCHSVQVCVSGLLKGLGIELAPERLRSKIAGINHMAWLLEISDGGRDLYPEIKKRARQRLRQWRKKDAAKSRDMVRLAMMLHFGYYITESSEHNAEYTPYWIKSGYPELIEEFNIPLDEYPRRCVSQIERWSKRSRELVDNPDLTHFKSNEYGARIIEAIETDVPCRIGGNVLNRGLIPNLPHESVVEVPCLVDRNGVQGCYVGRLPEQCAALNRTNINVHLMTLEAARTRRRDAVYQAAMLDPHTAAELPLDRIRDLCDDLIAAHGKLLPRLC